MVIACVFVAPCVLPSVVSADTTTAMGDHGGEGSTPFTGVSLAPDTNLFTGGATTSIPIDVPKGRKSATPKLALVYSSTGGPGPFGFGWDLPIGRIERNTKFGIPRCTPPHDDFVLVMPGGAIELKADGSEYRPLVEDAYLVAKKFTGASENYWEVYDRSGMTFVFGKSPSARAWTGSDVFMQQSGGVCNYTGTWALTQIIDPNKNHIDIAYVNIDNVLQPVTIQYGGNLGVTGAVPIAPIAHLYSVNLTYEPRGGDPNFVRYLGGVRTQLTQRLQKIVVRKLITPAEDIRTYNFAYDQQAGGPKGYQTILNAVTAAPYPTETFAYSVRLRPA